MAEYIEKEAATTIPPMPKPGRGQAAGGCWMGMKVGDRVMIQPQTFGPDLAISKSRGVCSARPDYPGTVTYIHPLGRWYQVTFDNGVKECFFVDVEPTPLAPERGLHHGAFWREIK